MSGKILSPKGRKRKAITLIREKSPRPNRIQQAPSAESFYESAEAITERAYKLAINSPTLIELKVEALRSRPQARFLGEPSDKPINESAAALPQLPETS